MLSDNKSSRRPSKSFRKSAKRSRTCCRVKSNRENTRSKRKNSEESRKAGEQFLLRSSWIPQRFLVFSYFRDHIYLETTCPFSAVARNSCNSSKNALGSGSLWPQA